MLVLPFYVVVDVSYSMTQVPKTVDGIVSEAPLSAGNKIVRAVKEALDVAPILADKVRFSLLDFSDDAQVVIPMCDLMKVHPDDIPDLNARGGTSFVAAFNLLKRQVGIDVAQLKADGHKVHRPAAFFLTDGEPTDEEHEWRSAFESLTDSGFKERPNFIPFGVGDAKKNILDQLVYPPGKMRSFVARQGEDPAAAITSMAEKLVASVLASANSFTSGDSAAFIPPAQEEDDDIWL
ncbi:MAG: vWA domain-containing protein [Sporichthyaceae bacterium]